jgi:hypothetical protein
VRPLSSDKWAHNGGPTYEQAVVCPSADERRPRRAVLSLRAHLNDLIDFSRGPRKMLRPSLLSGDHCAGRLQGGGCHDDAEMADAGDNLNLYVWTYRSDC